MLTGPLPLLGGYALAVLFSGQISSETVMELYSVLLAGPFIWLVSTAVWAMGLLVAIPAWWLIRQTGRGTRNDAIIFGALSVGATWTAVLAIGGLVTAHALWGGLGAFSGGLAGYFGWRAGTNVGEQL